MTKIANPRYRRGTLEPVPCTEIAVNVSLTPELEELIHERVRSGRYSSASEVVREALRLLADRDELRELRMAEIRAKVAEGLESLDRGEALPGDEVFDRILNGQPPGRRQAE